MNSTRSYVLTMSIFVIALGWQSRLKPDQIDQIQTRLIPREVLFTDATKKQFSISPDGTHLAYIAHRNGVSTIWLRNLSSKDDHPLTDYAGIASYAWSPTGRSLLYTGSEKGRAAQSKRQINCLYSVDLQTRKTKSLVCLAATHVRIVYAGPKRAHDILIELIDDHSRATELYAVDLASGRLTLAETEVKTVKSWLVDAAGSVRGKVIVRDTGGCEFWIKGNKHGRWQRILSFERWYESDHVKILGFSNDGTSVYMLDPRPSGTNELIKLDCSSGHTTVIFNDPQYDCTAVMLNRATGQPQAVTVAGIKNNIVALDAACKRDIGTIQSAIKEEVAIVSRSDDDTRWLIAVNSDVQPGKMYLYNRQARQLSLLYTTRPELENYELAPMNHFALKARDGLKLEGYVTYPVGIKKNKLPMVLMVHGGPHERDAWGCNLAVQLLANRGYLCVQVNFRGSVGYGKAFAQANAKEWGGKMHDDLLDTVQYFIDQGIADPQKIAIYGQSYGGYAALCGAAFTPDIFQCAISCAGPSNLITTVNACLENYSCGYEFCSKEFGKLDTNQEFLKSRSPLCRVDAIKIPVLIVNGGQDQRVRKEEVEEFVAKLKEHRVSYKHIFFPDEGHGIIQLKNRLHFCAHVEEFLAKALGGRCQDCLCL